MAFELWPSSGRFAGVVQQDEGIEWDVELVVYRNGVVHTSSLPGARWVCELWFPDDTVAYIVDRRRLESLLTSLRGGAKRLRLGNLLTPKPLGTLQTGTPQVATTMAEGATSVNLKLCNGTLLRGDRFQFGATGQRVMATADATPDGSANMTVAFEPAARVSAAVNTAIVYDKPFTSYILAEPRNIFPSRQDKLPGFGIRLIEGAE